MKKFFVKFIISLLLLFYITYDINLNKIFSTIKHVDGQLLTFAFSLHFVGIMISSIRWKVILNSQGTNSELKYLFKSYLVANFFNQFLPSTVGGDSIRTYDSWKLSANKEKAFVVVLFDRFLGLLTLLIFALVSILLSPDIMKMLPELWFWITILSMSAFIIIWFIFSPPTKFFKILENQNKGILSSISGIIYKLDVTFSNFSQKRYHVLSAILLSVLLQFNVVLYYFAISKSLNLNMLFIDYFLIVPLTIFITMIPISINGVGLRESALYLFLAPFGILQTQAIAFAWLEYGMLLLLGVIGGIFYLLRK